MARPNLSLIGAKIQQNQSDMTSGQKAAATKRANAAAAGNTPIVVQSKPINQPAVASDIVPAMQVQVDGASLLISLDNPESWQIVAVCSNGNWTGQHVLRISLTDVSAKDLPEIAADMTAAQEAITNAAQQSEDNSVCYTVATLATLYRVSRIKLLNADGTSGGEIARGETYRRIMALTDEIEAKSKAAA